MSAATFVNAAEKKLKRLLKNHTFQLFTPLNNSSEKLASELAYILTPVISPRASLGLSPRAII